MVEHMPIYRLMPTIQKIRPFYFLTIWFQQQSQQRKMAAL